MELERYRDAMEGVPFDPELEARVLGKLEAARAPRRRGLPKRRLLCAALCAALCLAVTAGAYGTLSGWFTPRFEGHPEIIDRSGAPLSASAADAGYTVTANALFGDKNCLYVAMTLAREDGAAIDADGLYFNLEDVDLPGFRSGGYGAQIPSGQGSVSSVSLSASLLSGEPILQGNTLTLTFDRLVRVGEDRETEEVLAEGDWTLSFPISYTDLTRTLPLDAPIPVGDTGLAFDYIDLSPLSVWVGGTGLPNSDEDLERVADTLTEGGFTLTLRDGTVLDLFKGDAHHRGFSLRENDYLVHMESTFQDLIPLEEMASLTFCGVEISLKFAGE